MSRWFVFIAMAMLGWCTEAKANHITCTNGAQTSAAEICPIFVQGDPTCVDAAQICSITVGQQVTFAPPPNGSPGGTGITVSIFGNTAIVKDTLTTPDQQNGRPGIEAIIARRNSAYIYCGTEILNDVVKAPGTQAPNQVTICLAKGPCGLSQSQLNSACSAYNPDQANPTANFIQAYKVGPVEQSINLCGCPNTDPDKSFVARFCDIRFPVFAGPGATENPRFVSCNPDGLQQFKSAEAEGTATLGTNSCVMRTIGGRRILVDSATGSLC